MSKLATTALVGLTLAAASTCTGVQAQGSGATAPPWSAASPAPPRGRISTPARSRGGKPASVGMNTTDTSGLTPTGPDISTQSVAPNDLTGSTGPSSLAPLAEPPPGIAPPNGAPDTSTPPNDAGGPHG